VILSHTWGEDEITFQDIQDLEKAREKKRFQKLEQCCRKAQSDGFQWVWIDNAVSIKLAVPSYPKPSIQCTNGIGIHRSVTHIWKMYV
jgi:hypothetical protein